MVNSNLQSLVRKLFYYLDIQEVSDSGKLFRPNFISTCRTQDGIEMSNILKEMKKIVTEGQTVVQPKEG